jgi:hypothetical protein
VRHSPAAPFARLPKLLGLVYSTQEKYALLGVETTAVELRLPIDSQGGQRATTWRVRAILLNWYVANLEFTLARQRWLWGKHRGFHNYGLGTHVVGDGSSEG